MAGRPVPPAHLRPRGVPSHFKVAEADLAFDDVVVAEYLTYMEQLDSADIHLYS